MDYEVKRIQVTSLNIKKYYENNIEQSLQPFVNKVLEKFFNGTLVEITNGNRKQVEDLAVSLNCTNQEAINHIFNSYQFIVDDTPKQKIKLDRNVKKFKTKKINRITEF